MKFNFMSNKKIYLKTFLEALECPKAIYKPKSVPPPRKEKSIHLES